MPTFDGKSEKMETFENLFETSFKIHNQLTEEDKINYFHSLLRGNALQTLKNITRPNRGKLGEILSAFCRKYVKPKSMATSKHDFPRPVVSPANQKVIDFLDELQELAKTAFGVAAQTIIKQFINTKMPASLKKSINKAQLENGTYEQIVPHLEKELELNGLEAPDDQQINTVTQQTTQQNSEKPKLICHHCKNQVAIETNAVNSNEKKTKPEITREELTMTTKLMMLAKQMLTPTIKFPTKPTQII